MAIYLIKNIQPNGLRINFTPEETRRARDYLLANGFVPMRENDLTCLVNEHQFISISLRGGDQIQVQETKREIINQLLIILQPQYFMTDQTGKGAIPIAELEL